GDVRIGGRDRTDDRRGFHQRAAGRLAQGAGDRVSHRSAGTGGGQVDVGQVQVAGGAACAIGGVVYAAHARRCKILHRRAGHIAGTVVGHHHVVDDGVARREGGRRGVG